MEKEIVINEDTYRIKEMNAVEILSMQSFVSFDSVDDIEQTYNSFLERIEVKVKDKWMSVKSGKEYYPNGVENSVETISKLIVFFKNYLQSVFQKSNESK